MSFILLNIDKSHWTYDPVNAKHEYINQIEPTLVNTDRVQTIYPWSQSGVDNGVLIEFDYLDKPEGDEYFNFATKFAVDSYEKVAANKMDGWVRLTTVNSVTKSRMEILVNAKKIIRIVPVSDSNDKARGLRSEIFFRDIEPNGICVFESFEELAKITALKKEEKNG